MSTENIEEKDSKTEKKSLLSKIVGWAIKIIFVIVVFYFAIGYFENRQEEFIQSSINAAITKCGDDQACIDKVKQNGRKCVKDNYHQERVSKRVKKSILEEEGFYSCLGLTK